MPRISPEDLTVAAAWLQCNEGDGGESDACARVAGWLFDEADRRRLEAIVRDVARDTGNSVSYVRRVLKKKESK